MRRLGMAVADGWILAAVLLLLTSALAGCESDGNGTATGQPTKPPSMAQWLENAGSQALTRALEAYESGDYSTASKQLRPLAEAGDPVAQYGLGLLVELGLGVNRDDAEAVRLFRLSAEQGHPAGQNALGVSYLRGKSDEKDYAEAVKWLRLAADQGYAKGQYNLGRRYWHGEGVAQDHVEGLRLIRLAADQGYPAAQSFMGGVHANGEDVPQDYAQAVRWYRLAADQGYRAAQYHLGRKYLYGQGVAQDRAEGLRLIRLAAEQGYARAQNFLGTAYAAGEVLGQDYVEAVRWYRMSAEQGYAAAQYHLAFRYRWGEGVKQDYAEAARWYRRAADQGDSGAQTELGLLYDLGKGVGQDHVEAVRLYRLAADQGYEKAQYSLSISYGRGESIGQDYEAAAYWCRLAAEKGYARAQTYLGYLYENGYGVPQDNAEALRMYRAAADQGYAGGQYRLGVLYEYGKGVDSDYGTAAGYYVKSAMKGYPAALNDLGVLYELGNGVPKDYVAAYALYSIAAQQDNETAAENRVAYKEIFTLQQLADAERLIAAWRPESEVEQSPDFTQGLLWRVESPSGAISHVFGTMHSAHPKVASPPLAVRLVLDTADSVMFETVAGEGDSDRLLQMMLFPEGTRLVDITGQEMFDRLVAALEPYGLSADELQKLRPWAIWTVVLRNIDDAARRSSGESGKLVLDDILELRARENGTATFGLETAEEQFTILSEGDEAHHLERLESLLASQNRPLASTARRLQYLAGDLAGLYRSLSREDGFVSPESTQDFVERIIRRRNHTMTDRMLERLESGNAVVAVGALHLYGQEGIPSLLAQRGYKVVRVY